MDFNADSVTGVMTEIVAITCFCNDPARGIVNRSRKDITECLTMHPLVGSYSLASKLTDEYIKLNAPYIGDWRD